VIVLFYFLDKSLLNSERLSLARSARFGITDNSTQPNYTFHEGVDVKVAQELESLLAELSFEKDGAGANGNGIRY